VKKGVQGRVRANEKKGRTSAIERKGKTNSNKSGSGCFWAVRKPV